VRIEFEKKVERQKIHDDACSMQYVVEEKEKEYRVK
jgi:hypothetical protein